MKKHIPDFKTDKEAEDFVDTANLADYDLSDFKPIHFEIQKKGARINMRVPQPLMDAVKDAAKTRDIPYQRFIREVLEEAITHQPKR